MGELHTTKILFANAFKELLCEIPLNKISVREICEKCDMNRKSFYYHFKDKEDLICWIFDSELLEEYREVPSGLWETIEILAKYLYENRSFYKKVLKAEGQNSISQHLQLVCYNIFSENMEHNNNGLSIRADFFADAIVCAIKRWLLASNLISPAQLVIELKSCFDFIKM